METLLKRAERSSGELSVPYCDTHNRTHSLDSVVECTFHRRLGTWLHFEGLNKLLIHPSKRNIYTGIIQSGLLHQPFIPCTTRRELI